MILIIEFMTYFLQVNSEFYTGWLDHWGSKHSTVGTVPLAHSLDLLLSYSNSTNINM